MWATRHRERVAVAALAFVLLTSGCASGGSARPDTASPVTGLITAVEGFTIEVRTGEEVTGRTLTFEVADPSVPMQHLEEHRSQRLPVRVHFERRDNRLVATLVEET